MQKAIARQAEAERERRAKIINSEGEFPADQKIYEAAEILSHNPDALQLRPATLLELGGEESTIVVPLHMDHIKPFPAPPRRPRAHRPGRNRTPPSRAARCTGSFRDRTPNRR